MAQRIVATIPSPVWNGTLKMKVPFLAAEKALGQHGGLWVLALVSEKKLWVIYL
jgi:hypothetical protein